MCDRQRRVVCKSCLTFLHDFVLQVLALRTKLLGHDNPLTLCSKSDLAASLGGIGRHADAEILQRQVCTSLKPCPRSQEMIILHFSKCCWSKAYTCCPYTVEIIIIGCASGMACPAHSIPE